MDRDDLIKRVRGLIPGPLLPTWRLCRKIWQLFNSPDCFRQKRLAANLATFPWLSGDFGDQKRFQRMKAHIVPQFLVRRWSCLENQSRAKLIAGLELPAAGDRSQSGSQRRVSH